MNGEGIGESIAMRWCVDGLDDERMRCWECRT